MSHKKLLILILFTLVLGAGLFGYTNYAQATTFADCPTTYGTIVCGPGEQYCGTCTTSISDNRAPQWTLNCGTCTWSCPAPNVSCGSTCGPAYSGENPTCVTKKVTTDQCGNCTTTCRVPGDTYCSSSGTCLTPTACGGGSTWNGCACVANPYIIASPASPQSAYINVTGNTTIGDDLYMTSGKALRVDGAGTTNFNFGNWGTGATGFNLNVNGDIDMINNNIIRINRTQYSLSGTWAGINAMETINSRQDMALYSQRNIYLIVDEQPETSGPQSGGDLIVAKDSPASAVFLIVKNDGKVGIGTPNPGSLLEVNGQSIFGNISQILGANQNLIYGNISTSSSRLTGNLLMLQKESVTRARIDTDGNIISSGYIKGTDICINNDCRSVWPADGTSYWTQAGTSLYHNNLSWNVGIGITNPTNKLQIQTTDNQYGLYVDHRSNETYGLMAYFNAYETDTATNRGYVKLQPANYQFVSTVTSASDDFYVQDQDNVASRLSLHVKGNGGNTESFAITSTGNAGIGTATPTRKLSILDGVSGPITSLSGLTTNYRGLSLRQSSDDTENWFTGANSSNNFVVRRSGSVDDLTINSSGNIGIGISGPTSKLDINGAGGAVIDLNVSGRIRSNSASGGLWLSNSSDGFVGNNSTNIGFWTNGVGWNAFQIVKASGNVGIGTGSPARKLSILDGVSGPIASLSGLTTNYRGISVRQSSDDAENWFVGANGSNNFVVRRSGSVDNITIDSTGSLTLSSLSGGTNRCVQSDSLGKLVNASCTASNPFIQNGNSFAALAVLGTNDNNSLAFETNNVERMRINTVGNVGIGTTNPTESLEIQRASGGDAQITLESTPSTAGKWSMRHDRATEDLIFWNGGSNRISFANNGDLIVYGGNIYASGGDVAEEFSASSDLAKGTVVIMGDEGYKSVKPSNKAYDQTVIGVVSDDAGVIIGHIGDDNKAQIAMVGVVGVKVTSENGSIKRGDLLVTSSSSGYAMKSTKNIVGTVIGKALEDFSGTKGNIKALINLQ